VVRSLKLEDTGWTREPLEDSFVRFGKGEPFGQTEIANNVRYEDVAGLGGITDPAG
jgi:hypothetical protein